MPAVSENPSSRSQVQQTECQCDLAHTAHRYKCQVLELQERLSISRRRNFELQQRLEDVEGAMFRQAETPCGDEAGAVGEGGVTGERAEGEDGGFSLREALAQEEAKVASDLNWPAIASPMRVSIWAKHKLIAQILQELWGEEHTLLTENSKLKQRLEREREESAIVQQSEAEERRDKERELREQNQVLQLQIARLEEQLSRIAQLTRSD